MKCMQSYYKNEIYSDWKFNRNLTLSTFHLFVASVVSCAVCISSFTPLSFNILVPFISVSSKLRHKLLNIESAFFTQNLYTNFPPLQTLLARILHADLMYDLQSYADNQVKKQRFKLHQTIFITLTRALFLLCCTHNASEAKLNYSLLQEKKKGMNSSSFFGSWRIKE